MPMEQLDWQLCELKKHCHSSANRKASKCNCSFMGTLLSSYLLLGVFGRPVLPHWESGGYCFLLLQWNMVNWKLPRVPLGPEAATGSLLCTADASSQDSYRMLCSLLLFLSAKLVFKRRLQAPRELLCWWSSVRVKALGRRVKWSTCGFHSWLVHSQRILNH